MLCSLCSHFLHLQGGGDHEAREQINSQVILNQIVFLSDLLEFSVPVTLRSVPSRSLTLYGYYSPAKAHS